jgi:hypothetical protein
MIKKS